MTGLGKTIQFSWVTFAADYGSMLHLISSSLPGINISMSISTEPGGDSEVDLDISYIFIRLLQGKINPMMYGHQSLTLYSMHQWLWIRCVIFLFKQNLEKALGMIYSTQQPTFHILGARAISKIGEAMHS